jgi:predicted RNA-binding Zn-ribbon protein involved in translation (DUF1610 family)
MLLFGPVETVKSGDSSTARKTSGSRSFQPTSSSTPPERQITAQHCPKCGTYLVRVRKEGKARFECEHCSWVDRPWVQRSLCWLLGAVLLAGCAAPQKVLFPPLRVHPYMEACEIEKKDGSKVDARCITFVEDDAVAILKALEQACKNLGGTAKECGPQ